MRKDYAKQNLKKKRAQKKSNRWLSFILLIIVIGSTGFLFANIDKMIFKKLPTTFQKSQKIKSKTTVTPKFDFYDISFKKNKEKTNKTLEQYELVIATVNSFARADRIKAELALQGVAANITPIYQQNTQKYYISIGPYDNKDTASVTQKKLKINKINSKLKKVR